jgi:hypothetical protein
MDDKAGPAEELATGVAELEHPGPATWDAIAVLWIPDPEQRHGWREFYVRSPPAKPGGKYGFPK